MEFQFEERDIESLRIVIKRCQKFIHVQQVAYSTYHDCLTQVCFGCRVVRTSMKKEDYLLYNGEKPLEEEVKG